MLNEPIERRLIDNIQPIRFYTLAVSIYHLFETGLFDRLEELNKSSIKELASELSLDEEKLEGFLLYLKNEGIVHKNNDLFYLTDKGRELKEFRGWYTMLIGGYGETFHQIGEKLKKDAGWATRNALKVGVGSCHISHYDAIPLTRHLMNKTSIEEFRLLDLGCGNARYLVEFCKSVPKMKAWGVEPDRGGYNEAVKLVKENNLENRINLSCCSAVDFFKGNNDFEPNFVVLGFVLHEILAQEGEQGVIQFINQIIERFPDIHIIIIEVDDQINNPTVMRHGLSLAYYNPYYLLHYFTNQHLKPFSFWENLFKQCNLEIIAKEFVNKEVDSTELEVGYLLKQGMDEDATNY